MRLADSYQQQDDASHTTLPKPGQQAAQAARLVSEDAARCVKACFRAGILVCMLHWAHLVSVIQCVQAKKVSACSYVMVDQFVRLLLGTHKQPFT